VHTRKQQWMRQVIAVRRKIILCFPGRTAPRPSMARSDNPDCDVMNSSLPMVGVRRLSNVV
jgi:hypothetical protein